MKLLRLRTSEVGKHDKRKDDAQDAATNRYLSTGVEVGAKIRGGVSG